MQTIRCLTWMNPSGCPSPIRAPSCPYLKPEAVIQSDHPEILSEMYAIGAHEGSLWSRLSAIYRTTRALESRRSADLSDALAALRQGRSGRAGSKSFVCGARSGGRDSGARGRRIGVGIGGPHAFPITGVEAYVAGRWVPFDPTHGFMAELPGTYLVLHRGDERLFRYTSGIHFDYVFSVQKRTMPSLVLHGIAARVLEVWVGADGEGGR